MIIYLAKNLTNGKCYIGYTKNSLEWRKKKHYALKKRGYFQNALHAYKKDEFEWSVIEEHGCIDELKEAEVFMIAYMRSIGVELYNLTDGGDGASSLQVSGTRNPFYGKKHSNETKAKMSKASSERKRGKRPDLAERNKTKSPNQGKPQSKERIAKRVDKLKGKKRTPEQRERIRQGALNRGVNK